MTIFTRSSSIRQWTTLKSDFPNAKIINTGFGGSKTKDLLRNFDELVIHFKPKQVFIYVGENDINAGKSVRQGLSECAVLMERVSTKFQET